MKISSSLPTVIWRRTPISSHSGVMLILVEVWKCAETYKQNRFIWGYSLVSYITHINRRWNSCLETSKCTYIRVIPFAIKKYIWKSQKILRLDSDVKYAVSLLELQFNYKNWKSSKEQYLWLRNLKVFVKTDSWPCTKICTSDVVVNRLQKRFFFGRLHWFFVN